MKFLEENACSQLHHQREREIRLQWRALLRNYYCSEWFCLYLFLFCRFLAFFVFSSESTLLSQYRQLSGRTPEEKSETLSEVTSQSTTSQPDSPSPTPRRSTCEVSAQLTTSLILYSLNLSPVPEGKRLVFVIIIYFNQEG